MRKVILLIVALLLFCKEQSFAQITAVNQASGLEQQRQLREKDNAWRQRLEHGISEEKETPAIPAVESVDIEDQQGSEQVLITSIIVEGNTILSVKVINKIILPYENRMLSMSDLQQVADLLTDAYRQRGYITTRAVLSPQQISNHIVIIKVVQGQMGQLEVRGNHYFKERVFARRVELKKGEAFNYNRLRNNLRDINEHPDRYVTTSLMPGKEPGQTDVLFDVKDRIPLHAAISYDNFASKYIGSNEYTATVTDNNLLGFDDMMSLQYQTTDRQSYQMIGARYVVPVSNTTNMGFFLAHNDLKLQRELKDINARGKSKVYSVFVDQTLVNKPYMKIVADAGFDYKDVYSFELNNEVSRDRLRVAKLGFNVDYTDSFYGRNIFSNEFYAGIPNIMGALYDKDSRSSRVGAGGQFTKDTIDLLRLQQMPLDTALLIKTEAQLAGSVLPAVEQYQLGGIANVRGFGPGEAVGDSGETLTTELSVPLYFIPRNTLAPFSKEKLYDATRIAAFYDLGHVNLRNPQVGESKNRTLDSAGCGLRFNLPENFSSRLDAAWPISGKTADSDGVHIWTQATKEF